MKNVDFENKKIVDPCRWWSRQTVGNLVDGELGVEVVENVVGGRGEAAGVGENEMSGH